MKRFLFITILSAVCLSQGMVFAQRGISYNPKPKEAEPVKSNPKSTEIDERMSWATDKFGRGLTNVLTGALEVPIRSQKRGQESSSLSGAIQGAGEGFVWMFIRMGCGVWDTVTSPGSLIIPDEKPIIDPPTVFDEQK